MMTLQELHKQGIFIKMNTLSKTYSDELGVHYTMNVLINNEETIQEFYIEREGFLVEDKKHKVCKVIHTFEQIDVRFLLIDEEPFFITTPSSLVDKAFDGTSSYATFSTATEKVLVTEILGETDPEKQFEFKFV